MLVETSKDFPKCEQAIIHLQDGMKTIVDRDRFEELCIFHWIAKKSFHCWYAIRWTKFNGKRVLVRMHRQVAQTPQDLVCHHINGNSLDNRKKNLMNLTEFWHNKLFAWR